MPIPNREIYTKLTNAMKATAKAFDERNTELASQMFCRAVGMFETLKPEEVREWEIIDNEYLNSVNSLLGKLISEAKTETEESTEQEPEYEGDTEPDTRVPEEFHTIPEDE
jgi:hypothetical protein